MFDSACLRTGRTRGFHDAMQYHGRWDELLQRARGPFVLHGILHHLVDGVFVL